jgi:hypothetical protein
MRAAAIPGLERRVAKKLATANLGCQICAGFARKRQKTPQLDNISAGQLSGPAG